MYLVLPFPDMHQSAKSLSSGHLSDNIIAARDTLTVSLDIQDSVCLDSSVRVGVALYRRHNLWLAEYGKVMVEMARDKGITELSYFYDEFEGLSRAIVDDFENEATSPPHWVGVEHFHARMRAYLVGLDRDYYWNHGWEEQPAILPVGFSMLRGYTG